MFGRLRIIVELMVSRCFVLGQPSQVWSPKVDKNEELHQHTTKVECKQETKDESSETGKLKVKSGS